jgi:hypothetical protein
MKNNDDVAVNLLCAKHGLLVGTNTWLPTNPSELFFVDADLIGCNRIFCQSCRSWVRNVAGVSAATGQMAHTNLSAMYLDRDVQKSAAFKNSLGVRFYFCRCDCVQIADWTPAIDVVGSWTCAGHPPKGVETIYAQPTLEVEVESTLRSSAHGLPSFEDTEPWDFALRWRQPLLFQVVWPVVSRLLVDADPIIRMRSVEFVNAWREGDPVTLQRLMDVAINYSSMFRAPDLLERLAPTLASKAVTLPRYCYEIAKSIALLLGEVPPPAGSAAFLSEYEPDVVIQNGGRWSERMHDQSAATSAVRSMALLRRDHLLALLRALSVRSVADREALLKVAVENIDYPDNDLRKILDGDGIPMPQTHPTLDECRRALGLDAA